jgi:hypothetical protein
MSRDLQQRISALRSIERRLEPEAAWMRATRETLLMQVRNSLPTEPVQTSRTVRQFFSHFIPRQFALLIRGPVMATLAIFIAALGGSVASVSAAERSLPGDFLYSLKLATEQARLAFTPTKEDKLKLKVEFTNRRGEDIKSVSKIDVPEKPDRVERAAEILKRDLNTVKQQLEEVKSAAPSEKVVEVAKLVDESSNQLVQSLQETKSGLSDATKGKIVEAQAAAADTSVKAIEVLVEKHQESEDSVSETWVVQAIQDHAQAIADVTGDASLASSTAPLADPNTTSTVSLPAAIEQIKVATQTAFAEMALADLSSGSSTTIDVSASSTAMGTTSTAPIVSSSATGTTSSPSSESSTSGSSTPP